MSRIASATEFRSFCNRKSCSESLRLRSTMSLCSFRKPEICNVMYAEYATIAASVMINPSSSAFVGDRCQEEVLCTRKEYLRPYPGSGRPLDRPAATETAKLKAPETESPSESAPPTNP